MAAVSDPFSQAHRYYEQGDFSQVIHVLQDFVKENPRNALAYCLLGKALKRTNRLFDAQVALETAIRLHPALPEPHYQLGLVRAQQQKPRESVECYCQALAHQPHFPEAHCNLGLSLGILKERRQAESHFRQAIAQHPQFAEAHFHLAAELESQGRSDEAIASFRRVIDLKPEHFEACNRLGILLARGHRFDEAIAQFRVGIRLKPDRPAPYHNVGLAMAEQDQLSEALGFFDEALRRNPDHGEAHKSKGMALLKLGQMSPGWAEYEWRHQCQDRSLPDCAKPLWDGGSLHGKTILVRHEQGFGDSLQFIRYTRHVKAAGGIVHFECPTVLSRLLKNCEGIDRIVSRDNGHEIDVYAPLLSLPRILKTTLETVPAEVPYLFVEEPLVTSARREILSTASFNVGIVWQGNPRQWDPSLRSADQRRSIPLALFEPLANLPGVRLYSLQKGFGVEQLSGIAGRFDVIDLGSKFSDFLDTATVMKNLDLVITVDSAPAHLAGGLGIPVWVALPFISCWRWLTRRQDSPWYPTMRLFRQVEKGNWNEVFTRMTAALRDELQKTGRLTGGPERPHTNQLRAGGNCLVSVVIPCFNAAEFLEAAVQSVLTQNIPGTEVIIVDDCSADATISVADSLARKHAGVTLIRQTVNEGPSFARNRGLRSARGRYVCFLDAGDKYLPGFFIEALFHLERDITLAAVASEVELFNCHREVDPVQLAAIVGSLPSNIMVRRTVADLIGGFPEHTAFFRRAGDEDVLFRIALRAWFNVILLPKKFLRYRVRRGSNFDGFIDSTRVVDGKLVFLGHPSKVTQGPLAEATKLYNEEVARRVSTVASLKSDVQIVPILSSCYLEAAGAFDALRARFEDIEGYLHPKEGFALYLWAKGGPGTGAVVEIGSLMGRSTCWLASGTRDAGRERVVAVDHFCGSPEHQKGASHSVGALIKSSSTLPVFIANLSRFGLRACFTIDLLPGKRLGSCFPDQRNARSHRHGTASLSQRPHGRAMASD